MTDLIERLRGLTLRYADIGDGHNIPEIEEVICELGRVLDVSNQKSYVADARAERIAALEKELKRARERATAWHERYVEVRERIAFGHDS